MSRTSESNAGQQNQGDPGQASTHVGQNIRDMGSHVRDVAAEKYQQVRDQASEKYSELREQAANCYEKGRQRATEWEQSLETYVREKPIQAILMAAGVGVLLGILWKRG